MGSRARIAPWAGWFRCQRPRPSPRPHLDTQPRVTEHTITPRELVPLRLGPRAMAYRLPTPQGAPPHGLPQRRKERERDAPGRPGRYAEGPDPGIQVCSTTAQPWGHTPASGSLPYLSKSFPLREPSAWTQRQARAEAPSFGRRQGTGGQRSREWKQVKPLVPDHKLVGAQVTRLW